ncbi:class I SAM-dependent methyltransferase (plasmid) [Streptosporangium sp. CA-135522]|uniref:class I SAM-dependent methyltransferase n=1 Tax=Streptosporangium sp. CA-135522 TaxID=3240072 RepID=UPI003D8FB2E7
MADDVRAVCLPPFRRLIDRLAGLRLTILYEDPFESYFHQRATTKTWDLPTFTGVAKRQGGRVLDVGCARGRVALALTREGLEVTAIDGSHAVVARLRATLAAGVDVTALYADLFDRSAGLRVPYATITLGNTSVNMFVTDERLLAFLTRTHELLAPDGVLRLPVLAPQALAFYSRRNGVITDDSILGGTLVKRYGADFTKTVTA